MQPQPREYGRGTGVPDPIDVYVGSQIRTRRQLLDMNQEAIARELGLTFQQVQKYESGANRVSASRLWEIAAVLKMPIAYFSRPRTATSSPRAGCCASACSSPRASS